MARNPKRFFFVPFIVIIVVLGVAVIVMALWNAILPSIFQVKKITYGQALGILVLCRILFGSFRPGPPSGIRRGGPPWKNKLLNMSPEEREKFKKEWQQRCRSSGEKDKNEDV